MKKQRKQICSFCAALLTCAFGFSMQSSAAGIGDVNSDGKFNVSDLKSFSEYMFGNKGGSFDKDSADMDFNGKINIADFIMVKNSLLTGVLPEEKQETEAYIHLKGTTASCEGENVSARGNTVTISASGIYYIDGTLNDGQICVNVPDVEADAGTVKLYLKGVNITGKSAPAILIENAENTSINLEAGTENVITDGDYMAAGAEEIMAAVYAKDDLTIKGEGKLTVNAATQYGIHCNNDLKINGGDISIYAEAEDGIRGKKSVSVKDGMLFVDAGGDGIKSTKGNVNISGGTVHVKAGNDAIQAETLIEVSGGEVSVGGDKALTAPEGVNITGGNVLATASDEPIDVSGTFSNGAMILEFSREWSKNNPIAFVSGNKPVFEMNTYKKFRYAFVSSENISPSSQYDLYVGGINAVCDSSKTFKPSMQGAGVYSGITNTVAGKLLYANLFNQSVVHDIQINMPDWNRFLQEADKEEYFPADVVIDGEKFYNVGVRTKGNGSHQFVSQANSEKYSLRIKFNKYDKYVNYHGLTEMCINNMFSDPSCMRDILCYNALQNIGGIGPVGAHTNVSINGKLHSFYYMAEQPGETLMERYSTHEAPTLYKSSGYYCSLKPSDDIQSNYKIISGPETASLDRIKELTNAIDKMNTSNYKSIESIIDVDSFLKGIAVNAVMCNYDSYNGMMAHNFYLIDDGGLLYFVGWDYHLSLGNFMDYGASVNSDITKAIYNTTWEDRPLIKKLLSVPDYYDRYVKYVKQIVSMYSDPESVVNSYAKVIRNDVKADPHSFFTPDQFESNIAKSAGGLQVSANAGGMGGFGGFGGFGGGGFGWALTTNAEPYGAVGADDWGGGFNWGGNNGGNMGGFNWGDMGGGNNGGNMGGFDFGNMGGFGGFGGFGGGGVYSYGGDQVSIVDFMIKRNEVIHSALNY